MLNRGLQNSRVFPDIRFIYTSKNVNSDFIIERKISMIKYSLAERKFSLKLSRPSVKLCKDPKFSEVPKNDFDA